MKRFSIFSLFICFLSYHVTAQETGIMLKNALAFVGTPYTAHTLEANDKESLIINLKEVDCTTFVEYVLAMSLCPTQGKDLKQSDFEKNLQRIRYRNGIINGYTSRLHYTSDWINNGIRNGFLEDITAANSTPTQKLDLSFMSTHPQLYKQLANSPENVAKMAAYEKALTGQEIHWIPKDSLPATGFPWIQSGDIIAITTQTPGLDLTHMGIANYIDGKLCLLHASSTKGKVSLEKIALSQQLDQNPNWTGIRIIRMKK